MKGKTIEFGLNLISTLGYPGLFWGLALEFLGIPFPGEIVLIFTGFLVWDGHLELMRATFFAVTGSLFGMITAYLVGLKYGRPFLENYGKYVFIKAKKIDRAEVWIKRHGLIVLLFGRFIPGVRPISAYMAGIAKMKLRVFLPMSLLGSFLWCFTFIMLGNMLGQNWISITPILEKYDLTLIGLLFIGILVYFINKSIRKRER